MIPKLLIALAAVLALLAVYVLVIGAAPLPATVFAVAAGATAAAARRHITRTA
jgi:hypothetical protein